MTSVKSLTILILFTSLLCLGSNGVADASVNVSAPELRQAISDDLMKVEEFKFIREQAQKMRVRVWLFGGTAAGYGHYVKWDLERKKGDTRFQPNRFDYDFTNIYRSTQDLDIVVDSDSKTALELQRILAEKFPHVQGSKSAWEVRLLKASMGDKAALLDNPDFLNQHTDSNSTGLIEITKPPAGEEAIRDLRNWKKSDHFFFKDLLEGKLHYYYSERHSGTSRFLQGLNPPILSVIRYLTKAFQFELEMRPEDLTKIKKLIKAFDPKASYSGYVENWIERNASKLIQNAVNIEYAWETLEKLGLREKLMSMGDPSEEKSMAWWLNKEPLRSKPLGEENGKTAGELGIDIVAHETSDFLAYESITRAHTGDANVLISRSGAAGESAGYGNGFYTQIGRQGAAGTGFTIRFHLDPKACEGSDFIVSGSYIVILNKNAIRVIPESLNMGSVEYFRMLNQNETLSSDDKGILEKLKRRIGNKMNVISSDDADQIIADFLKSIRQGHLNSVALQEWLASPLGQSPRGFQQKEQITETMVRVVRQKKVKTISAEFVVSWCVLGLSEQLPQATELLFSKSLRNMHFDTKTHAGYRRLDDLMGAAIKIGRPGVKIIAQLIGTLDSSTDHYLQLLYTDHPALAAYPESVKIFEELIRTSTPEKEQGYGILGRVVQFFVVKPEWYTREDMQPLIFRLAHMVKGASMPELSQVIARPELRSFPEAQIAMQNILNRKWQNPYGAYDPLIERIARGDFVNRKLSCQEKMANF